MQRQEKAVQRAKVTTAGVKTIRFAAWDRLMKSPLRNLVLGVLFMLGVMACASFAYIRAGWSVGDAVYMVILTVYTVGFDEVRPIDTPYLRGLTMGLIVIGCTGMLFLTGALIQFITINQLQQVLGIKRMKNQVDQLNRHVIICGYGRLGVMLAQQLRAGEAPFVILERNEARLAQARAMGYLAVQGDATDEDALRSAGIDRARLLATVLPDDAANVFITLSARSLNRSLEIIARGEAPSTESKLLQAGADKVVLPAHIGAERIAEMVLYAETARIIRGSPRMHEFEQVLHGMGLELEMITAGRESGLIGLTVAEAEARAEGGIFIVQLDRGTGDPIMRPPPSTRIEPGDGIAFVSKAGKGSLLDSLTDKD